MIVRVAADYAVRLHDRDDFKRFKVVVEAPQAAYAQVQQACAGLIEFETPDKGWVAADALQAQVSGAGVPEWKQGFERMMAAARPHGWIKDGPLRVAAHVEWVNAD